MIPLSGRNFNSGRQEIWYYIDMKKIIFPATADLPQISLYMDQLLEYLQTLGISTTKHIVNNYVKQKIIPAPVKKRYDNNAITRIIVIEQLKGIIPLASAKIILGQIAADFAPQDPHGFYKFFLSLSQSADPTAVLAAAGTGTSAGTPAGAPAGTGVAAYHKYRRIIELAILVQAELGRLDFEEETEEGN